MKKILAAVLVLAAVAAYGAGPTISLSVGHPKVARVRKPANPNDPSYEPKETYETTCTYAGKVGCTPPKDATITVKVEAYFITRPITSGTVQDTISGNAVVGEYTFGNDTPKSQKIEFTAPTVEESKPVKGRGGSFYMGADGANKPTKSGTKHVGVIVRALVDGKVQKVVSMPNNPKWVKAGKEEAVSL